MIQDPDQVPAEEAENEERRREQSKKKGNNQRLRLLLELFDSIKDDLLFIIAGAIAALVRAAGTTIETGTTGLLFSFGRARREMHPGFHFMIPFLQSAKRLPTRSRTLDLPAQRVATMQGLVYHVDANLVYRIVDVRKALIQIDDVEKGMIQMLGLGVQEVLRHAESEELRVSGNLDRRLTENLQVRLEAWGVAVEHAGFPSITPSPQTLRITQLERVTDEREDNFRMLLDADVRAADALGLIGTRSVPGSRTRARIAFEHRQRRIRRLKKQLVRRGWTKASIKQAEYRLLTRISTPGRLRPGVSR
ncbi:MAG: SPFH domain-containing protein [bacterium]|nr:SPFH domain-containing protein [bacterium]